MFAGTSDQRHQVTPWLGADVSWSIWSTATCAAFAQDGTWSVSGWAVEPVPTWEAESSDFRRAAELQREHLTGLLPGVLKITLTPS